MAFLLSQRGVLLLIQDVMASRYVENGSLLHTLKAFGNLPEGLVASYVVKILEGLDYLHSQHVRPHSFFPKKWSSVVS